MEKRNDDIKLGVHDVCDEEYNLIRPPEFKNLQDFDDHSLLSYKFIKGISKVVTLGFQAFALYDYIQDYK